MVSDSDLKSISSKSDAELEALIDSVHKTSDAEWRLAAIEEKIRRQKEKTDKNDKVQNDIRVMTLIILVLTILSVVIGVLSFIK